jgi:hypothetical protein
MEPWLKQMVLWHSSLYYIILYYYRDLLHRGHLLKGRRKMKNMPKALQNEVKIA